jgi:hypothetical protein
MLLKPDLRILTALSALEDDPNFKSVLEWLEGSLDDLDINSRSTKDEVLTRWNQGASQVVGSIVGTARTARATLSRNK